MSGENKVVNKKTKQSTCPRCNHTNTHENDERFNNVGACKKCNCNYIKATGTLTKEELDDKLNSPYALH